MRQSIVAASVATASVAASSIPLIIQTPL
jgi:hypothetical protein